MFIFMENQIEPLGKKILLVDDDDYLRGIYESKFKEEGFEVIIAKDGQEALEKINAGLVPDVIFTGIIMPRLTGFEFVRKIQADKKLPKIPIAIFSHRNRLEDRQIAEELCVEFFAQGFIPIEEIIRRVQMMIGEKIIFKIKVHRGDRDLDKLIDLLSLQQGISCSYEQREIILDLEAKPKKGEFRIKLFCEPT